MPMSREDSDNIKSQVRVEIVNYEYPTTTATTVIEEDMKAAELLVRKAVRSLLLFLIALFTPFTQR